MCFGSNVDIDDNLKGGKTATETQQLEYRFCLRTLCETLFPVEKGIIS